MSRSVGVRAIENAEGARMSTQARQAGKNIAAQ